MKNWLKMVALSLVALAFVGCEEESEPQGPTYLEVTPNNIAGSWQLVSFANGQALSEENYVYIDLVRQDRTFRLFQNLDSFSARCLTGEFNIENDLKLGAIIRGMYDYDNGEWQHRYIVTNLTETEMTWTALDDPSDVSLYVRAEIPAEILASAPAEDTEE